MSLPGHRVGGLAEGLDRVHSVCLKSLPVEGAWRAAAGMGGMRTPSLGSSCEGMWRLDCRAVELTLFVWGLYLESGWSVNSEDG